MTTAASATHFTAAWFDGVTARRHEAAVGVLGDRVEVSAPGRHADYRLDALRLSAPVAGVPLRIGLPDGGTLVVGELDEHVALSLGRPRRSFAHVLESNLLVVFVAWIAVFAAAFFAYRDGIPWVATKVATRVPVAAEAALGESILSGVDKFLLERSRLPDKVRTPIAGRFAQLAAAANAAQDLRLEFRRGRGGFPGANAFALPGGTIVVTDDLVVEIDDADKVAAVLAHEIGHQVRRHALVHLFETSATALVFGAILGDVSGVGSVAAAAPGFLLNLNFSRGAEEDADRFAYGLLRAAGMSPALLGDALQIIVDRECGADDEDEQGNACRKRRRGIGNGASYLSTHPDIDRRIEAAREAATR
jgi:Zn-dependent protease with chaperone function